MQSLMFLACFVQKLSKKNLWRMEGRVDPALGNRSINVWYKTIEDHLKCKVKLLDPLHDDRRPDFFEKCTNL